MLTVSEALASIVREVEPLGGESSPLLAAFGRVLAQNVLSTVDSPPFDKALMDGYAVRAGDVRAGIELKVIEEVTAGRVPNLSVQSGQATRIMTGAPIPAGCDAVVKVEDTEVVATDQSVVRILARSAQVEQNIIRQGTSMRSGESILVTGRRLRAQELAALAETGCASVVVGQVPRVAVLATGDELVDVSATPGPGQIRNSNATMLAAQIYQAGCEPITLGIARDNEADLRSHIAQGLQHDVLLLSGGVSAGKLDLVPSELERAGVQQVFHKVNVKPGKPVWFGVRRNDGRVCYVFGLPGNPVSSMVCFELFVRTALRRLLGVRPELPVVTTARLSHPHRHTDDRETYFPAVREGTQVRLMHWHGSSDLQSTRDADCMVIMPSQPVEYQAGDEVNLIPW